MATSKPHNSQDSQKKNNSLRDFQGINTQAYRTSIGDNQFAWLENVMPIGFGNMIVPPGPSYPMASWTGTAYHMRSITISTVTYMVIFCTNGAVYAVNLATNAATTVAAIGTLSGDDSEICQWEDTTAIIIDTIGGYYSWDGTTFTKLNGTVQSLTITTIGTGYTSAPALGFSGGGGSAAAASCHIQVATATLVAAGLLYNVNDLVTIAGGTSVRKAVIEVTSIGAGGAITGFNLYDSGDYTVSVGVLPAAAAATTSLYGSGATLNLKFGIGPIVTPLTNIGSGYTSAPAVAVTGGAGAGGAVTANLSVVPNGGTSCATYAGRVWVSSGRTVVFSAPGSFDDFTPANGGGSFIMVDETLVGDITALRAANNFLYIVGPSSVNVIADVSVNSLGATVFSNTNISASIGTEFEDSIISYYRSVWFANPYGIYALYGTTTQKASDDLDGIFPLLLTDDSVPSQEITAGTAVINEIMCLCFLTQYKDPVKGQRSIIFVYFNKKWWIASQRDDLVSIETAIVAGAPTLYGTNGTQLFHLFSDIDVALEQTIITKLWDMGDPLRDKQTLKFGLELVNPTGFQSVTGTIDTEYSSGAYAFSLAGGNIVKWINNQGNIVKWINNAGQIVDWASSGYTFQAIDVETTGKYIGVTLHGNSAQTIYSALHLQHELRASW